MDDTAKREKCPSCGSHKVVNNHYLRERHHDRVYVECADCGTFIARYIIHAYVDPAFSFNRFLARARKEDFPSGRGALDEFQVHQERATQQFGRIKELLADGEATETIRDLFGQYRILEDG